VKARSVEDCRLRYFHATHLSPSRALPQLGFEILQLLDGSLGKHFYAAVVLVTRPPAYANLKCAAFRKRPVSDTLHHSRNQIPPCQPLPPASDFTGFRATNVLVLPECFPESRRVSTLS